MTDTRSAGPRFRPARVVTAACWLPLVMVAIPAVAVVFGQQWYASSDWAVEVVRNTDVGGPHTPLVGVASRFGWYHPGPAMFWFLAPFERVAGPNGILLGTLIASIGSLAGAIWVAWRRGGAVLVGLTSLALALVVRSLGVSLLLDPWNPWVAFCPFVLFLFLVWSGSGGRPRQLGWAAILGSAIIQTHVGYVPVVLSGLVAGLAFLYIDRALRRSRPRPEGGDPVKETKERAPWRRLAATVSLITVFIAIWIPPLVQQINGHPGNITELISYFRDPPDRLAGWRLGLGITANQLQLGGPWTGGRELNTLGYLLNSAVLPALVPLLILCVLVALCVWRRRLDEARLGALAVVLSGAAALAVTRVSGLLGAYLVRWAWAIAVVLWVSIAWCVVSLLRLELRRFGPRPSRVVGHFVPIVAVIGAVLYGSSAATQDVTLPIPEFSKMLSGLSVPARKVIDPKRPVTVYSVDSAFLAAGGPGLALAMQEDGFDVRVPPDGGLAFGSWRVEQHYQQGQVLALVAGSDAIEWRKGNPGYRLVAHYDPLSEPTRRRANLLDLQIRLALGKAAPKGPLTLGTAFARQALILHGAPAASVEELATYRAQGDTYLLYYQDGKKHPAKPR